MRIKLSNEIERISSKITRGYGLDGWGDYTGQGNCKGLGDGAVHSWFLDDYFDGDGDGYGEGMSGDGEFYCHQYKLYSRKYQKGYGKGTKIGMGNAFGSSTGKEVGEIEYMEPNFWKEIYGEDYILGH